MMKSGITKEKEKPVYTNRGTFVRKFDDEPLDPLVTCYKFCGYSWYSKSKLQKVQCPNCHRLIDRLKLVVRVQGQGQNQEQGQNK